MTDPKPNVIDSYLYGTPTLKTVLVHNHADRGEMRPLTEFREVMRKNARRFAEECFKLRGIELDEDTLNDYETKIFGE